MYRSGARWLLDQNGYRIHPSSFSGMAATAFYLQGSYHQIFPCFNSTGWYIPLFGRQCSGGSHHTTTTALFSNLYRQIDHRLSPLTWTYFIWHIPQLVLELHTPPMTTWRWWQPNSTQTKKFSKQKNSHQLSTSSSKVITTHHSSLIDHHHHPNPLQYKDVSKTKGPLELGNGHRRIWSHEPSLWENLLT